MSNKLLGLFLIPSLSSLIALFSSFFSTRVFKRLAVGLSLIPLILLLSHNVTNWIGEKVLFPWFPPLSINFHLAVDSLSLLFLYLTAIIIPLAIWSVRSEELTHSGTFYGLALLLEGLLIGFFTARDLALFTVFWEAMLLPLYFMITLWGGAKRHIAALKFLIYMIAGSALMVAAVIALYLASGSQTFDFEVLAKTAENAPYAVILFFIFALAFAVKTPLFPFHAWLPDAYYEASTAGTILLSALLSKAGIYGFLRIGIGFFPHYMQQWGIVLLSLAIAGVLYGGLAAWGEKDFKRLLAYSSFSHVNFVLAGLFVWSQIAHEGSILQALNHGITIAGLFLVASWLEERLGTTTIGVYHGVAKYLPNLCWLTFIFVLSSIALPGTNSFIGELLILLGLFKQHPWLTALLGLTVVLSVIYMLRWMQKVYFEEASPYQKNWRDLSQRELALALPLIFLIFWVGLYPKPVLDQVVPAAEENILVNREGD